MQAASFTRQRHAFVQTTNATGMSCEFRKVTGRLVGSSNGRLFF
jgi:hypothetical protein